MSKLEQLTLAASWMAAAVVSGLALSLIPNVEIMTLTVFSGGILLGSRLGAVIGFMAMVLYVFANSAWRGFPPSPLPLLIAQALGMACAGGLGGAWRALWLRGGTLRKSALYALPLMGALAASFYQILVNGVSAQLFASDKDAYFKVFLAGLSFSLVQIVVNIVVFALVGPQVALTLRHLARRRGWWALVVLGLVPGIAICQDSSGVSVSIPVSPTWTWQRMQSPLWDSLGTGTVRNQARESYLESRPIQGVYLSQVPSPSLYRTPERWGWGWGRTQMEYDGLPLNGALHAFGEPPDVPLSYLGSWWEGWGATGTHLQLDAPPRLVPTPLSELVLSTGSYARRSVEMALFRNLGPVNLGLDLADREQSSSDFFVSGSDLTRFWLHLDSVQGNRPDWSLDWSTGHRDADPLEDALYHQEVRRLQMSLRGPVGDGEARISAQGRRQAFRVEGDHEIRVRGLVCATDLQISPQIQFRVQGNYDDRRGVLERASFWGIALQGQIVRSVGPVGLGLESNLGYQEPWGINPQGRLNAVWSGNNWKARASAGSEAGAPPLVDFLDRPGPVEGLESYLKKIETMEQPERTSAFRLEGLYRDRLTLGAWFGRQTGYRVESNPLWVPSGSDFRPLSAVERQASVRGVYGSVSLPLFRNVRAEGQGRIHNRKLSEVPYLPAWSTNGTLHFNRRVFKNSMDLDIGLGGELWGRRINPEGNTYEYSGLSHITVHAAIDGGSLFIRFLNLTANAPEADFRFLDTVTPAAVSGYHWVMGVDMHLSD